MQLVIYFGRPKSSPKSGESPHRASIPHFIANSDAPVPFVLGREVLNLTLSESLLLLHKWPTSNEDRTLHKQIQDMQQPKAKWAENVTSIQTVRQSAVHVKWIFMSKSEANITPLNALLTLELAWWRSWSWSYLRRVFFMQVAPGSNMIVSKSSGWSNWKLIFFREVFQTLLDNFTNLHGASFASFALFFVLRVSGQAALILPVCGWVCQLLTEAGEPKPKHAGMDTVFCPERRMSRCKTVAAAAIFGRFFVFSFFQLSWGIPF